MDKRIDSRPLNLPPFRGRIAALAATPSFLAAISDCRKLLAGPAAEILSDQTLLEVRPHTGRTHQIRVHLSAAGHPVVPVDRVFYQPHSRRAAGLPTVRQ